MILPTPASPRSWRSRAVLTLALVLSFGLVGAGTAPPASAAKTGTAAVAITAFTLDFYFADTPALVNGNIRAVDPALGVPTGSVTIVSQEPGHPSSDWELSGDPEDDGFFGGSAYPTQVGVRLFTVRYSGDATFAPASQVFEYYVPPGPNTQTTVTASPSGAVTVGRKVTFTSNTTDDAGRTLELGGASGAVAFLNNGVMFGEWIEVTRGTTPGKTLYATQSTTFSTPGTHVITAMFQPSLPFYVESTSAPLTLTVTAKPTPHPTPKPTATATPTTTPKPIATPKPSATPKPTATAVPPAAPAAVGGSFVVTPRSVIAPGSSVRATAEIHSRATGKAVTGFVQFYDGNVKVGTPVALVKGHATLRYQKLSVGRHVLKARYLGTKAYAAAFTRNVTVTVRR
ncbi:Ig-like domain-containing protein [Cryobacterium sp. 1639]|uniref:Ig-like domain-containing protein n=1 Tax=Cryobacterium inferilacus TaxID=2866629 RepID=UPI001C729FB8|nr:Ig-like domain-containing protein [Cryobacterium sp. 1639]MBX0301921.1 Ig-like domain-containing protein [Cryobacterium sp. 1639]